MKATLVLEDGSVFYGHTFAGQGEVIAPLVFNSGMVGYQETITDPGHAGRMLCFTYPLIGSYGVNEHDNLSDRVQARAVIVREYVARPRNYRATASLADLLNKHNVIGVQGMDTRAITRRISQKGPMKAVLSTLSGDPAGLLGKIGQWVEEDLVAGVTSKHIHSFSAGTNEYSLPFAGQGRGRWKVAVLDLGVRTSLLTRLLDFDLELVVLPASTGAQQIMELKPHGLIVSGGPGAPTAVPYVLAALKELIGKMPVWGIGLGHLLLAEAVGAEVEKAVPGYFAGSQTVQEMQSGKVGVSEQNITHRLRAATLPAGVKLTYSNQVDNSIAGFMHEKLPLMGVSFHPEVWGGPLGDSAPFADFTRMLAD